MSLCVTVTSLANVWRTFGERHTGDGGSPSGAPPKGGATPPLANVLRGVPGHALAGERLAKYQPQARPEPGMEGEPAVDEEPVLA